MDATYLIAKNFAETGYESLPKDLIEETKKQVLDLFGCAVGGFTRAGAVEVRELIADWGGKPESTIMGTGQKVPAPNAAQANASMVHALDYDDVHEAAVMHPGVISIPTAIAIAERMGGVKGTDLIAAIALGSDIMCRFGLASTPGKSPIEVGWHQTTLFGFMGSACVAGKMLGLSEDQIVNAMGIAYHQSGGNGQCTKDGALTKRLGPGFSVKGGTMAALLAQMGVTGAHNCIDADWGLYKLYWRGDYDSRVITRDLGKRFEGMNVSIKPYPCCRGIHPAIDAALAIVTENEIKADDVKSVALFVSDAHLMLLSTPFEQKVKPRSPVDAQFSIPWGVSTAIARRRATLEDFSDEGVKSPDILAVAAKVSVAVDPALRRADKIEPTRVEITTNDGRTLSRIVENPLGSPERPLSFDDCARKFKDCAKDVRGDQLDSVIERVAQLEKVTDIGTIVSLLVR
jgi:2-methylcitrate dehydratase PrpD